MPQSQGEIGAGWVSPKVISIFSDSTAFLLNRIKPRL